MPGIVFKQLSLRGFGRYKDQVTAQFTPGINVLTAPNESGKSTLIAGLTAVIFGLPASSDPAAFGTAKHRNWDGAAVFGGELLFEVDGALHQITRDFDTQRVTIRRQDDGRWIELVRGTHNPRANKPNERYLQFLDAVFGLRSAELFMQTYCVAQPMPAATAISDELQQLLSGGGSHYSGVLVELASGIKQITRFGSHYYSGLNNGRKDQMMEEIRTEKERLEQAMTEQSNTAGELQQVLQVIAAGEEQRRQKAELLQKKEAAQRGFERWLALRDRLRAARSRLVSLRSATERALELEKQIADAGKEEADTAACSLTSEITSLDDRLAGLRGLAALGPEPEETIQHCHDWLSEKLKLHTQRQKQLEELRQARRSLQSQFVAFEVADPKVLQQLPSYLLERPRLLAEVDAASRGLQQARQAVEAMAVLRKQLTEQLADPESISYTDIARLQVYSEEQSRAGQANRPGNIRWVLAAGLAASIALYAVWGRTAGTAGTVVSLLPVLFAGVSMLAWRPRMGAAGDRINLCKQFPLLVQLQAQQLADLLVKLQQYKTSVRHSSGLIEQMQAAQQEAECRLRSADSGVADLVKRFPLLDQAFAEWRQLRSRLQDLDLQVEQLNTMLAFSAEGNCGFESIPGRLPALLPLMGCAALRGEALLAAVSQREQSMWSGLTEQAVIYKELVLQRTQAADKLKSHSDEQLGNLEQAKAALNAIIQTNSCPSVQILQERVQDAQEEVLLCRQQWRELLLEHPDLPDMTDMENGQAVASRRAEIMRDVEVLHSEVRQLDREIYDLKSKQSQLEGRQSTNLAQAVEQLAEITQEERRLVAEATALGIAATELSSAIIDFQQTHKSRLANRISDYFRHITGDDERSVVLDDNFTLHIKNGDGQIVCPAQLSQGAQDQLYLAVRMSVADLMADDSEPPFVLDDPLLTSDEERLARMQLALQRLGRQIILLSHHPEFSTWGTAVIMK